MIFQNPTHEIERRCLMRRRLHDQTHVAVFDFNDSNRMVWAEAEAVMGDNDEGNLTVISSLAEENFNPYLADLVTRFGPKATSGVIDFVWFDVLVRPVEHEVDEDDVLAKTLDG